MWMTFLICAWSFYGGDANMVYDIAVSILIKIDTICYTGMRILLIILVTKFIGKYMCPKTYVVCYQGIYCYDA